MKKLLMFVAFAVVLCSCGSGGSNQENNKKKFDEEIVKEDRKEYKEYIRMARQYKDQGNVDAAIKLYEYALEIESTYSDTEYSEWFNSDVAGTLESIFTGTHKNHEWVDMGLPSGLKWATCNVGASSPEEYGDYFAWGETKTNKEYYYSKCASWGQSWGDIRGDYSRDAARSNWGGGWRLPTKTEFEELLRECTWEWTTQNGNNGYKVTSKKNGQSIFLPAAGYRNGADEDLVGSGGYYWSSTPYESETYYACRLYFDEDSRGVSRNYRHGGRSVRPVLE